MSHMGFAVVAGLGNKELIMATIRIISLTGKTPEWKGEQNGNFWLGALAPFDGQPVKEFTAHMEAHPRLTKKGKPDPASGWLRWLSKNGYLELVEVEVEEPTAEA